MSAASNQIKSITGAQNYMRDAYRTVFGELPAYEQTVGDIYRGTAERQNDLFNAGYGDQLAAIDQGVAGTGSLYDWALGSQTGHYGESFNTGVGAINRGVEQGAGALWDAYNQGAGDIGRGTGRQAWALDTGLRDRLLSAQQAYDVSRGDIQGGAAAGRSAYDQGMAQTGALYDPYIQMGTGAVGRLNALSTDANAAMMADPGYRWRLQEGNRAIQNSAAANRVGLSSNTLRALADYNQGAASQEYGNVFARQQQLFTRQQQLAAMGYQAAAAQAGAIQWGRGGQAGLSSEEAARLAAIANVRATQQQSAQGDWATGTQNAYLNEQQMLAQLAAQRGQSLQSLYERAGGNISNLSMWRGQQAGAATGQWAGNRGELSQWGAAQRAGAAQGRANALVGTANWAGSNLANLRSQFASTRGNMILGQAGVNANLEIARGNAQAAREAAQNDGGVWPAVGQAAGTIIGAYFGGPMGAQVGGQLGGAIGSSGVSNYQNTVGSVNPGGLSGLSGAGNAAAQSQYPYLLGNA